jgi:hypothetical protein
MLFFPARSGGSRLGRVSVVIALMIALGLGAVGLVLRNAAADTVSVVVDFAHPHPVNSTWGVLLSASPTLPPDAVVQPLHPGLWREGNPALIGRAKAAGARFVFVASELWGYPPNNFRGKGPPDLNWVAYEAQLTETARRLAGRDVQWDVWNEPNWHVFWTSGDAAFFELYRRAYRILRREAGPSALIGGPSISHFDPDFITRFLKFCVDNGCEVNVLSWHELTQTPTDLSQIAAHIEAARKIVAGNPAFAALNVKEYQINEFVGAHDQYYPAENLAHIVYLEQGGIDRSARACWNADDGTSNCANNSLDGLLLPGSFLPRAAWWVYRFAGAGVSSRVSATSSAPPVVALASDRPDGQAKVQVLVGLYDDHAPAQTDVTVTLRNLDHSALAGAASASVTVERLANTDESSVRQPLVVKTDHIPVISGTVTIPLAGLRLREVFAVSVAPAS